MTTQELPDDIVPKTLRAPVAAALQWINDNENTQFRLTGIVDEQQALDAGENTAYEIGLVLCDGEICKCERVRIIPTGKQYEFKLSQLEKPTVPALLDPPKGLRKTWLDEQLDKHEFLLLLFYRGRW